MVTESAIFDASVMFWLRAALWYEVDVAFQILDYVYLCKYYSYCRAYGVTTDWFWIDD
jgi:hypothetical protein